MAISNVWGQGQLFAFSALDGKSELGDDFVGILSGDRIGIRFFKDVKRELAVVGYDTNDLTFDAVLSDLILANVNSGKIGIAYADTHLVIGKIPADATAVVMVEGIYKTENIDGVEVQDTSDSQFTAIAREGEKFAFAYAKDKEAVVALVKKVSLFALMMWQKKNLLFIKNMKKKENSEGFITSVFR